MLKTVKMCTDPAITTRHCSSIINVLAGVEAHDFSGSTWNDDEADAVVTLVKDLLFRSLGRNWCDDSDRLRIVTFYKLKWLSLKNDREGTGQSSGSYC